MLPIAIVSFESNVHDAGEPTMSDDTSGVLGVHEHARRAGRTAAAFGTRR